YNQYRQIPIAELATRYIDSQEPGTVCRSAAAATLASRAGIAAETLPRCECSRGSQTGRYSPCVPSRRYRLPAAYRPAILSNDTALLGGLAGAYRINVARPSSHLRGSI